MSDQEKLDKLISKLYDTVLDPEQWNEAMLLCARQVGCIAAHIMTLDKKTNKPIFLKAGGDSDLPAKENQIEYIKYYRKIDPRMTLVMANSVPNQWQYCTQYMDQKFVKKDEFYQDFLIPKRVRYAMGMWVDENENTKTVLGLHRSTSQNRFITNDGRQADRFTHHLQKALRLQMHTEGLRKKAELGLIAIDSFGLCVFIVDGNSAILHLNSAAENLLDDIGSDISCKGGHLFAESTANQTQLANIIKRATTFPRVGGAMNLNSKNSAENRQIYKYRWHWF
jgi:hypothetical protein